MSNLGELWSGTFGDDYTARNALEKPRTNIWASILPKGCTSVLEVGANIGRNLQEISQVSNCTMYATEPNSMAREMLRRRNLMPQANIKSDFADSITFPDKTADLVFTCGVLIHVEPRKLQASLSEIHRCAKRWIICGEYFAPSAEAIRYHGHDEALWRRDYGSLYLNKFSDLRCVSVTFAWQPATGLDNVTFWVFEKT